MIKVKLIHPHPIVFSLFLSLSIIVPSPENSLYLPFRQGMNKNNEIIGLRREMCGLSHGARGVGEDKE